jgi:ubiquinone/menaquinone biosynthesis C-methylase UbiE
MSDEYQYNFSENYPELYDKDNRKEKALKTISILSDYIGPLNSLKLLDIGSSTGIMTYEYSKIFDTTVGIDIDENAVAFAKKNYDTEKIDFICTPIEELKHENNFYDVITCSHIYEHVPDANKLMSEIYRLLKPGGVCFFAAGNRFKVIEGHYRLPFLSFFPKRISNLYLKITGKGNEYYENHLSYKNLKQLVNQFEIIDYTVETIKYPKKYFATDLITENTFRQKLYLTIAKYFYFLIPTYLWLLKKSESE